MSLPLCTHGIGTTCVASVLVLLAYSQARRQEPHMFHPMLMDPEQFAASHLFVTTFLGGLAFQSHRSMNYPYHTAGGQILQQDTMLLLRRAAFEATRVCGYAGVLLHRP